MVILLFGGGNITDDFLHCHFEDAVKINILLINLPTKSGASVSVSKIPLRDFLSISV